MDFSSEIDIRFLKSGAYIYDEYDDSDKIGLDEYKEAVYDYHTTDLFYGRNNIVFLYSENDPNSGSFFDISDLHGEIFFVETCKIIQLTSHKLIRIYYYCDYIVVHYYERFDSDDPDIYYLHRLDGPAKFQILYNKKIKFPRFYIHDDEVDEDDFKEEVEKFLTKQNHLEVFE